MANKISVQLELDGAGAIKSLTAINKQAKSLGTTGTKAVKRFGGALSVAAGAFTAGLLLRGVTLVRQGFQTAARDVLDFGKAVAEVNSIVPRTATETLALKQQLIALSNEFGDKPQRQARAFYNILSAGITDTSTALNTLEAANKAAVAGLVDVDTAARGLLSVVNSYTDGSVNAAQASDILFAAVREGRTTFGELADTIGRVSSISSSAGVAFSEVAGALAFVTKSGIKTDETVIGLRQLFTSIIGPTDDVAKAAKAMGIDFSAAALRTKGLSGFMQDLAVKTGGSVEKIRALFPNVRAFNVAIKIAGGDLDDFNRILDATANSTGDTDKALKIITDSAGFQFTKLTNQLRNFPLAILTNFEEPISDALKAVNEFVGSQGILLIVDAVDAVIDGFKALVVIGTAVDKFFNDIAVGVLKTADAYNEFLLAVNLARQAFNALTGDTSELESLKQQQKQLIKNREQLELQIAAQKSVAFEFEKAEAKKIQAAERFQAKLAAGREKQVEQETARREAELAADKEAARKKLEQSLGAEQDRFNAIQELRAANKELEAEKREEEKLAKQLEADEDFQFLSDNLGREAAAKELARISEIKSEEKRRAELKKLRDKAEKEEKAGIFAVRKFEDLSNKEKIAAQKSTLSAIASLSQSSNSALFAIGKAASLSLAGINIAEGVTKALSAFPPPFNFAAAAAVGAAGAVQVAKIASAKPPSAGSFQEGGLITGRSQVNDRLTANVNAGETILNRRQTDTVFRAINEGNVGGGGVNVNINNPMLLEDSSVDEIINQINDAIEFRNAELRVG